MKSDQMIAFCGLVCESCDIRRAPEDPEAAERIVVWFKEEGWLKENEGIHEVIEHYMYCRGCKGDRSVHWSPECPLLVCCTNKGLEFCCQCSEFPCEQLVEWAEQGEPYSQALARLKAMKDQLK
jgi:hypothetical protein